MANIVLKTFAAGDEGQGTVTPQDDSLVYQNAVSVNGIFGGATVTLTGANTLHVASGFGIICGRFFEINESDISVQLSSSGTLSGRLKIHLDLNNVDNPIEIVTETGSTLPALSGDSNININGGAFDMELCTFSVNELTISSLVNTFPTIDNTSKQIRRKTAYAVNDFVLCQNASGALIFVCTTAGTTAVQEPTAYVSVASGSSVTDGTAVFKAYNLYSWIEGKAPKSHASTGTTYGIGTTTKYGHCMTINALTQSSHADGKALSAYQGKVLNDKIAKIGDLSNLNTTNKSSAVAAINEVNTKVSKTEVLISIVENGNTCTHTGGISKGQYVNWKGDLYTADSNISVGATFASSGGSKNLTAVTDGGLNDLNNKFVVENVATESKTVSGNAGPTFSVNVGKTGYSAIGVLTFSNIHGDVVIVDYNIVNSSELRFTVRNISSTSHSGVFSFNILYIKN